MGSLPAGRATLHSSSGSGILDIQIQVRGPETSMLGSVRLRHESF